MRSCAAGMDGDCWSDTCPQRKPETRLDYCPLPAFGPLALREMDEE